MIGYCGCGRAIVSFIVIIFLATVAHAAVVGTEYQLTDLGVISGTSSAAYDINNSGVVVGKSSGGANGLSFRWVNGVRTQLTSGEAHGINDAGVIAGMQFYNLNGDYRAYTYNNGTVTPLGFLWGAAIVSQANDINNLGQVVGWSESSNHINEAFLYENGTMTGLGSLGGESVATAINDSSVIVGGSGGGAFRYTNGQMTAIPKLPGGTANAATDINNVGQIVGSSRYSNGGFSTHAFLFHNNQLTDLGTLGGLTSIAQAINENGWIVGTSTNGSNANRGFIWRNGAMVDIATLLDGSGTGWTILDLTGINDSGSVVGTALTPGGQPHGILLTYIPEPSAFALAATAGAIALRRRRH